MTKVKLPDKSNIFSNLKTLSLKDECLLLDGTSVTVHKHDHMLHHKDLTELLSNSEQTSFVSLQQE